MVTNQENQQLTIDYGIENFVEFLMRYDGTTIDFQYNDTVGLDIDNLLSFTIYGGTTSVSSTYYPLTDHLGTVHENGNIVESYNYDAYGKVLEIKDGNGAPLTKSAIGNRYLWQGREYSYTTGLYYFRARYYDAQTGRWLSKDPIGISGGLNQYVFCGNNPVNFTDPWGLMSVHLYDGNDNGRDRGVAGARDFRQAAKRIGIFTYNFANDDDLTGSINYIKKIKSLGFQIDDVYIWDHGGMSYGQQFGEEPLQEISNSRSDMKSLGQLMTESGVIHLMGCSVGSSTDNLQLYANNFGREVVGSTVPVYYNALNDISGVYTFFFFLKSVTPEKSSSGDK